MALSELPSHWILHDQKLTRPKHICLLVALRKYSIKNKKYAHIDQYEENMGGDCAQLLGPGKNNIMSRLDAPQNLPKGCFRSSKMQIQRRLFSPPTEQHSLR